MASQPSAPSWYLLRCTEGHEEEVCTRLKNQLSDANLAGNELQALAPSEKITEIRDGRCIKKPLKYAGMLAVKVFLDSKMRTLLLETEGVDDFVSESKLSDQEISRIIMEQFEKGER